MGKVDVNVVSSEGEPAFVKVCRSGYVDVVKAFRAAKFANRMPIKAGSRPVSLFQMVLELHAWVHPPLVECRG